MSNITALKALKAFANGDGNEFVTRFGQVTQDTFNEWSNAVLNIPDVRNSFCSYLVNKIGRTYVNSMIANNPLEFLRGEDLPFGSTIEDMFTGLVRATQFDPTGKYTLDRKTPDVKVLYYYVNTDLTYKTSISDKELKLAFYREGQMGALIDRIIGALWESSRHDMLVFLKQLCTNYNGWYSVKVPAFDGTENTAKQVGASIKTGLLYSRFDNTKFNSAGAMNNIPEGEGLLLMTVEASVAMDFDYLANVFNLSKADLMARTVILDNFGGLTGAVALYCDKRLFQVHYLYEGMETQRNAEGRFTNYTLVNEAIFSMGKWFTGIEYTTSDTVNITFNANGGTGEMSDRSVVVNRATGLPFNFFDAPEGRTFKGWGLTASATGSDVLQELSTITPTADTTVYAIWG